MAVTSMQYDDNNIFAKILAGDIPCDKIMETDHCLAFADISPSAKVHTLVIPKGKYVCWQDFSETASDAEITDFVRTIGAVAKHHGIETDGYKLLANTLNNGGQEVPHLHVHVIGGEKVKFSQL